MERKNFYLDQNTIEKLKELSVKNQVSESFIVRVAINYFYKVKSKVKQFKTK